MAGSGNPSAGYAMRPNMFNFGYPGGFQGMSNNLNALMSARRAPVAPITAPPAIWQPSPWTPTAAHTTAPPTVPTGGQTPVVGQPAPPGWNPGTGSLHLNEYGILEEFDNTP